MPCSDLFIYFTLTLGTKMGNKIGVRLTIVVALACKYTSYLLLLFAVFLFSLLLEVFNELMDFFLTMILFLSLDLL